MIKIRLMTREDPAEAFVFDAWGNSFVAAISGGKDGEDDPVEPSHYLARELVKLRKRILPSTPAETLDEVSSTSRAIRRWIRDRLSKKETRVYIAYAAKEPGLFLGFVCVSPGLLHFIYVKKKVRGNGLARDLVQHTGENIEAVTAVTWPWTYHYAFDKGWVYDPQARSRATNQDAGRTGSAERSGEPASAGGSDAG